MNKENTMPENNTVEDFLADYHFADSDYQTGNGTLDLTVYGTNGSPLEIGFDTPDQRRDRSADAPTR